MNLFYFLFLLLAVTISTINAEFCIGRTCNSDSQTWCCPSYSPCGDPGKCLGVNTTTSLRPRCPGEQRCYSYSSYWCCSSYRKCGTTIGTCKRVTKNISYFIVGTPFLIFIILKWNSRSLTVSFDGLCPKRRKANATTAIIPPAQNEDATANPLDQSCIVLIPTTIPAATKEEHPPTYDTITSTAREQSEV